MTPDTTADRLRAYIDKELGAHVDQLRQSHRRVMIMVETDGEFRLSANGPEVPGLFASHLAGQLLVAPAEADNAAVEGSDA